MFVVIEQKLVPNFWYKTEDPVTDNVFGLFRSLEEAESFRLTRERPELCDCFLLQGPEDA